MHFPAQNPWMGGGPGWGVLSVSFTEQQGLPVSVVKEMAKDHQGVISSAREAPAYTGGPMWVPSMLEVTHASRGNTPKKKPCSPLYEHQRSDTDFVGGFLPYQPIL